MVQKTNVEKDIKKAMGGEEEEGVGLTVVAEVQRVLDHMVVIPHIQQVVSRVVIHCSDVLVGIGERDVDGHLLALVRVVHVVDFVPRPLVVVVFVHGLDDVQDAADHEGVGGGAFVVGGVPGALDTQRVGVELAHHDAPVVLLRGVDDPQAVLVHRQVDVRLPAPAVRRGVVVVCAGDDGLAALDARAQVELDDVARALLVEEERAIVHHEAGAVHTMGEFVGGGGTACDEVLLGRVLCQRVRAVWGPGHVVDLGLRPVTGLCTTHRTGGLTQRDVRFGTPPAECQDTEILRDKEH